jgi:hypothetical protein
VVFKTREDHDGVQEEAAETMVCSKRIFISCNSEERRLEFRCWGDVIMDAGGHDSCRKILGMAILPDDAEYQGDCGGKADDLEVLQLCSD